MPSKHTDTSFHTFPQIYPHNHVHSISIHPRCTTIVVKTGRSSVIGKAIIVEVNLSNTLLQHLDHGVERAETVGIVGAAGVGVVDGDDLDEINKWLCG